MRVGDTVHFDFTDGIKAEVTVKLSLPFVPKNMVEVEQLLRHDVFYGPAGVVYNGHTGDHLGTWRIVKKNQGAKAK